MNENVSDVRDWRLANSLNGLKQEFIDCELPLSYGGLLLAVCKFARRRVCGARLLHERLCETFRLSTTIMKLLLLIVSALYRSHVASASVHVRVGVKGNTFTRGNSAQMTTDFTDIGID